jgi:hypothetical protein
MAIERRYQDDEIRRIFDLAVSDDDAARPVVSVETGLTLSELQEVGLEVGIEPERIAGAAHRLASMPNVRDSQQRSFGMPVAACRSLVIPTTESDVWAIAVEEARQAMGVTGSMGSREGVREWTGGGIRLGMEPTLGGHQIHIMADNAVAQALNRVGITGLAVGLFLLVTLIATGISPVQLELATLAPLLSGATILGANGLRLPKWIQEIERQLDYIADRISQRIADETFPPHPQSRAAEEGADTSIEGDK